MYFGLAGTNSTDGRETIGFFQPDKEEFLEYDVASLIYRLGNPQRPTIGLMSSLIGTLQLSRAVSDPTLSNEILAAGLANAFRLIEN